MLPEEGDRLLSSPGMTTVHSSYSVPDDDHIAMRPSSARKDVKPDHKRLPVDDLISQGFPEKA